MNDKVNTVVIGKLIKEELQRQGKTSVWLANELGCHRTNIYKGIRSHYHRYGHAVPHQ